MYKYVNGVLVELSEDEVNAFEAGDADNADALNIVRADRDALLAATDWWVLPDRNATQAQLDYRTALRNVPQQEGFPDNVSWPTKPE
tara:strand:+ start:836 stop:1096 length:261 start_codon:yes stop_codon:yes gene_type:complete